MPKPPKIADDLRIRVDSGASPPRRQRKRSAVTLKEILSRELKATMAAQKGERTRRLSILEAIAAEFADRFAAGNVAVIKMTVGSGVSDLQEPPLKLVFAAYEEEI